MPGAVEKGRTKSLDGPIQSVKLQCVDCEMRFSVFLRLPSDGAPFVERSSYVRRVNGKYVHLCGGPMRLVRQ